ncbi:MAG: M20/M25/M40 family metallo-hydrolase [Deferribacteres bacterium]|nr:M20/M25/M40 family metallo-hydrolase [candidate division KSB1 bacterium]MCB9512616.1 M20/M25/M40 family metallo-hydrolase [Deferribacteres bacterium]
MKRTLFSFLVLVFLFTVPLAAQDEPVDLQAIHKIKMEGLQNSQVMETMQYLTDVYGPRLTNSPQMMKSLEWSRDKLKEWGMANAAIEPWGTFGRGWETKGYSIEMIEPTYMNVIAHPKAWTGGTGGVIEGTPILMNLSEIQSTEDLEKYKGKLADGIILVGEIDVPEMSLESLAKRHDAESLEELAAAPEPRGRRGGDMRSRYAEYRRRREMMQKVNAFLKDEGAKVLLEPSARNYSVVRVGSGGSREIGSEPSIAQLVVGVEHYNRIARLVELGIAVKMRIHVENQFYDDDSLGYNVVAEIPGSDKKLAKELVMLGGHIDSWHAGTGATDNAAGSAVMMEVMRILKAIDAKPRRTVRIGLWTGEEQGLLGSRGYVDKHFADRSSMETKPDWNNFSAYFNMDNGTGRLRGVYLQGNDAVRPIFDAWLKPFHDLGASTLTIRDTGGTDHLAFDAVGLPGFQFIQDPMEYSTRTHHTHIDVLERIPEADLQQAAVIIASFVYHAAMRDEKLPRKPKPEPQQGRRPTRP